MTTPPNITVEYFTSLFEEFCKAPRPRIETFIGIATSRVPKCVWGEDRYKYATALLTAHMLTELTKRGNGGAGPVTSEQVGDLSRTYATLFNTERGDALLLTTKYGIEFVQLRKETIVPIMTTARRYPRPFPPGFCN